MLLLYCMTRTDAPAPDASGVGGASMQSYEAGGIACWYSETAGAGLVTAKGAAAKDDVLAFHRVIDALFRRRTVIPFRFPTALADTGALASWLEKNAAAVTGELERLADMVQMELHISNSKANADKSATRAESKTGREFLEGRRDEQRALTDAAEAARAGGADLVAEWHQRETREGLRCYALVPRARAREFANKITLQADLARIDANSGRAMIRVSGPWPPAEFLKASLTNLA